MSNNMKADAEQAEVAVLPNAAEAVEAKRERRSLDQRIDEAAEALRKLQELKRKQDRALREQNEKELRELIRAEKLDDYPPAVWRAACVDIRAVLVKADKKR